MRQIGPRYFGAIHKPIFKQVIDLFMNPQISFENEGKLWRKRLHQTITRPNSSSDELLRQQGTKKTELGVVLSLKVSGRVVSRLMRRRGMSERNARYAWRAKIVRFCLAMFVAAGLITPGTAAVSNPQDAVRSLYSVLLGNMQGGRALGESGRYARLAPV